MKHLSIKTQTSKCTVMCGADGWSILGDVYCDIRIQSFNPENKNQE